MSETVNQTRAFEVLTATPIQKRRKPRDWPDEEKARLVAATPCCRGANAASIAGGGEGPDPPSTLLFTHYDWRRKAIASGSIASLSKSVHAPVRFAQVEAITRPAVEIVVCDVVVRVTGDVRPDQLAKILSAVRKA